MLIRDWRRLRKFLAGDGSVLRELLHPAKANLAINYSLAHATLKPKIKTAKHRLSTCEVYYVIKGNGVMYVNGVSKTVKAGQAVYIPPKAFQYIKNTGKHNLEFLCIVEPAWRKEDEEVFCE